MKVALSVLALAALFQCCLSVDITDTTGMRWRGYTMLSNVAGYSNMTKDYCDIQAAVASGNLTKALQIYEEGKNSASRTGLRKFMAWAVAAHPGEPTYDSLISYHKNASWLDNAVRSAFKAGSGAQVLGLIKVAIHTKYFFHEVDAAYNKVVAGDVNATEGAPHNLDEAWTLYAGGHPDQCSSLMNLADTLADEMGTKYYGWSPVHLAVTALMNDLQDYGLTGNTTLALYNSTRQALRVQIASLMTQGFMREAYAAYAAGSCKSASTVRAARDTAVAYWYALAPQLVTFGAKSADMDKVAAAITATNVNYRQVVAALTAVAGPVDVKTLGAPVFSKINKIAGCKAPSA